MEDDFEELDDLVEAHTGVLFILEQDAGSDAVQQIMAFLEIELHVIDLNGDPELERKVRANSNGLSPPVLFPNGRMFTDAFTLLQIAADGRLAGYLDQVGVTYSAENAAAIVAANQ